MTPEDRAKRFLVTRAPINAVDDLDALTQEIREAVEAAVLPAQTTALQGEDGALAEARAESLEACMESDAQHRAEVARLRGDFWRRKAKP